MANDRNAIRDMQPWGRKRPSKLKLLLAPGNLVQITDRKRASRLIDQHGSLWVIDSFTGGYATPSVRCKSVQTGVLMGLPKELLEPYDEEEG